MLRDTPSLHTPLSRFLRCIRGAFAVPSITPHLPKTPKKPIHRVHGAFLHALPRVAAWSALLALAALAGGPR